MRIGVAPADPRHRANQVLSLSRRKNRGHILKDLRRIRDRICRKQEAGKAALEQHLAHGIGVDRAVDADDAADPGEEEVVSERQVELAEDRCREREAGGAVRQPRVEEREGAESEVFELEGKSAAVFVIVDSNHSAAADRRGIERHRVGSGRLEAEPQVVGAENAVGILDDRDGDADALGEGVERADRERAGHRPGDRGRLPQSTVRLTSSMLIGPRSKLKGTVTVRFDPLSK